MAKLRIGELLKKVREQKPVVHHITNWVTIYDCANIVKVFGASPVMAHAKEEAADMAGIASALVLNIGTLTPDLIESMIIAAKSANKKGIPVVLDVCGAGATRLRDRKSFELLNKVKINIIKGNASEVARIAGEKVATKGVDAGSVKKNPAQIAQGLAKKRGCTVVITGKEDTVADKKRVFTVRNGHSIMGHVVGTGCMAASMIGTFAAVEKDLALAAAAGLACFEIAAEIAARKAEGPGTFKERLYDAAFNLKPRTADEMHKIFQIANCKL
ncbi:hydroxyethylthiazole kinase [Candidatus Desantisbacteria bacterium CG_4_10_14_0_8_um_filter_48_22]|uniref:Hydroxyethylthiazole kinase n=1 Tax=Candidatus Desantisbacteria bacterium CG_4_10_14_0_8_um_filter_48_22 TaxID=1974543 RepID=A0A2M7SAG4_9BACT|nr:MAG: hydroxyethylthiazole kinase [Candidatus Desantisbacteria bacterium CG_4_10_14_0_8_um_filter_48_22]